MENFEAPLYVRTHKSRTFTNNFALLSKKINAIHNVLCCKQFVFTNLTISSRRADCFIQRPRSYRTVNTFHLGYKNQLIYLAWGGDWCLFWGKYKTHQCSVGRTYSCWMLILLMFHAISRLKRLHFEPYHCWKLQKHIYSRSIMLYVIEILL
jgi:hypothetical protein